MPNSPKLTFSASSLAPGHTATVRDMSRATGVPALTRGTARSAWSDRRGGIAVMTGLLAVPLIGLSALAVDVGVWELNKSGMQGAADQAVLAAGLARASGGNAERAAKGVAAAHGFKHSPEGVETGKINVVVRRPTTGNYSGNAKALEVVITQQQRNFLASVVQGFSAPEASVRAVIAPGTVNTCVVALAPNGTAIDASGNIEVTSSTCNVYVNSRSSSGIKASGGAKISGYDIAVAGSNVSTGGSNSEVSATHSLKFNAPPVEDPYASRTPQVSLVPCKKITLENNGITYVDPGNHCEIKASSSDQIHFRPGLHIVSGGGLDASGSSRITGTGVTLVFTQDGLNYGGVKLSGQAKLDIEAMKTGPTSGIAIWVDKAGGKEVDFTGNGAVKVTGAIYAPGSNIKFSGNSASPCTQLIANTIKLSGNTTLRHDCADYGVSDVSNDTYTLRE